MKRLLFVFLLLGIIFSLVSCGLLDLFRDEGHVCEFSETRVESQHSCTTDGIVIRSCLCGRELTDITPARGHQFGDWETISEPSCTEYGYKLRSCQNCDETEEQIVPKTLHQYEITEEKIGDTIYNRYSCSDCGESFLIDSGITLPETKGEIWLTECDTNLSFVVITVEDEAYIRKHLEIRDLLNTEGEAIEYTLTSLGAGRWQVDPVESYSDGRSYIVSRDMGVFFENYGFNNLIFSIKSEKKDSIKLNDEIIYVADLEKTSPGYYPFSIEYSDGSGGYFLTLEKSEGLSIGDLICIGNATSEEDLLLNGIGTDMFGRIKSVTQLSDGRSLIMLDTLGLDEIFELLDVYDTDLKSAELLYPSVSFDARFLATLLSDPKFTDTIETLYQSAEEFLHSRGLEMGCESIEELISMIKVRSNRECEIYEDEDGRGLLRTSAVIMVNVSIPATLNKEAIGEIKTDITFTVDITEGSVKLGVTTTPETNITLDISDKITSRLDFISYADIDYQTDTELFLEDSEGYHRLNCEKAEEKAKEITISDVISGEKQACRDCKPDEIIDNLLVITDKTCHSFDCTEIRDASNLVFSENSISALENEGILPCDKCIKKGHTAEYANILENHLDTLVMKEYDMPDNEPRSMVIAAFAVSSKGFDRETFEVSMEIDFVPKASSEFSYERSFESGRYYRLSDGKIISHGENEASREGYAPAISTKSTIYIAGYKITE